METILTDDRLLVLGVRLASKIGLNEALVLQQLQYWMGKSTNLIEGKKWVYKTYEEWASEFPFWSISTLNRTLASLRKQELILCSYFSKNKSNRTLWYSTNTKTIEFLNSYMIASKTGGSSTQNDPLDSFKMSESSTQNECIHPLKMSECTINHRLPTEITYRDNKNKQYNTKSIERSEEVAPLCFVSSPPVLDKKSTGEKEFDIFWKLYPVKKGRQASLKAFLRHRCHLDMDKVLDGLKSQILEKSIQERLGLFCPHWKHPATWLNGRCWDPEVEEVLTESQLISQASAHNRQRLSPREKREIETREALSRIFLEGVESDDA